MKIIALYPGSFIPLHIGHLSVALQAKEIFGEVIVVLARNPKKSPVNTFPFPVETLRLEGINSVALGDGELLTSYVSDLEKQHPNTRIVIIRGLRSEADFAYEENLIAAYRALKPDVKVVHLFSRPEINFVSGTLLRQYGHLPEFSKFIVR